MKPQFNRMVLLLRASSGAGKSTFANYISSINLGRTIVCCADDYFTDKEGNYNFRASELSVAHKECQRKFCEALERNEELVIVANTNTTERELNFYIDKCKQYGYTYFSIVIENRNDTKNVHNVPDEALKRQENNLRNSIKLS